MDADTNRKLASIQLIARLTPIPGADKIETARVLGWDCVVAKKDNFKVGDKVVYIEIDSIVPDRPEFEFLRDRKFKVKTIKLRGQISQGLVVPLSILPGSNNLSVGTDVTDKLGIVKCSEQVDPVRNSQTANKKFGKIHKFIYSHKVTRVVYRALVNNKLGLWLKEAIKPTSLFPSVIHKTDETRIQAMPHILQAFKDIPFCMTEKLDGQSMTAYVQKKFRWPFTPQKYKFVVCSRNMVLGREDDSNWWRAARIFNVRFVLTNLLKSLPGRNWVALQGEVLGPGIQGNKYGLSTVELRVFNMMTDKEIFNQTEMGMHLAGSGISTVPVLRQGTFYLPQNIEDIVEVSKAPSILNKNVPREGIVVRNYDKNISFKVINPEFLLKYDS